MAKVKAKTRVRARAAAGGTPGVKKLRKKSFLVIVAPAGTTFPLNTQVTRVRRLAPAMNFDISNNPKVTSTHILLSIRGTRDRSRVRPRRLVDDTPDPGDLTITLTNQGPDIEPVVTVPVVFVDDFDPGP